MKLTTAETKRYAELVAKMGAPEPAPKKPAAKKAAAKPKAKKPAAKKPAKAPKK
ncbi:MAG: hypothetical protein ACRYFR_04960 [Janthinobacterium lividum]